jgi:hypothetical protein
MFHNLALVTPKDFPPSVSLLYLGYTKLAFLTKAKFAILGYFFENDVKNLSDVKTFFSNI